MQVCNFILVIPDKMKYPLYKNKLALDEEIPVGFILLYSLIWEPHKTLIARADESLVPGLEVALARLPLPADPRQPYGSDIGL
ncbi:hypothetical protein CAJAP_00694 [Camponotus japonicus]